MVPRIPEILLINAKLKFLSWLNYKIKAVPSIKYDGTVGVTDLMLFVNFLDKPFPGNTA
jgi:hypothetical protein